MKNKNPWETLSHRLEYENPWMKVTEFQVKNPAGNPGIYGVVHFKNIAIGILPLDEDGNTYLVGQYRYPLKKYSWEIPAGGCILGEESPLDCAKRELLEETGLLAEDWEEILEAELSNSVTDEVAYIFVARKWTQREAQPEETEILALKKLPFTEVFDMVMKGEITDMLSLAAIMKVHILLQKGTLKL